MSGSSWVALALSAAVILIPGLGLLLAARLRGWVAVSAAPAASLGAFGVAAVLAQVVSMPWNPLSLAIVWVVLAGTAGYISRRNTRQEADTPRRWTWGQSLVVASAVTVAALVIIRAFIVGMGELGELFYNFDSAFHYNAAYLVADQGQLTQVTLDEVNNYDDPGGGFYPPLLYGISAVVSSLSGAAPIVALNALVIACFSLALPLGLVGLIRILGLDPLVAVGIALCAGIIEAYPVDSLIRGPIFPFACSLAFIGSFLVLLVRAGQSPAGRGWVLTAVLGMSAAGAFLLHSSFPFSVAIFAVPLTAQLVQQRQLDWGALGRLAVAAVAALALAAPFIQRSLGSLGFVTSYSKWEPERLPSQALGNAVTSSHVSPYYGSSESVFPQWWVAALLIVGIVAAARLRPAQLWIVASWIVSTGLFVIAASIEDPRLRLLVGPWFSDKWRLWGLTGLAMILLAGMGLGWTLALVRDRFRRQRVLAVVAPLSVVALFVYVTDGLYSGRIADVTSSYFARSDQVLTDTELAAYSWLASQPDSDTVVLNQWMDGSALMLALHGMRPAWGTYNLRSADADRMLLWESFNELADSSEVQRVVKERGIRYVVVGNTYPYDGGTLGPAPGLEGLDSVSGLTLVYDSADTKIYRLDDQYLASDAG